MNQKRLKRLKGFQELILIEITRFYRQEDDLKFSFFLVVLIFLGLDNKSKSSIFNHLKIEIAKFPIKWENGGPGFLGRIINKRCRVILPTRARQLTS